jgi:hypothetical protein
VNKREIIVGISLKDTGRLIYGKTASCGEWRATDGKFVIEQRDDGTFVVTEPMPKH